MKQKLLSLITLYSLLFSLLVVVPQPVKAQNIVFTVTCVGTAAADTASLNAQIAAIGANTGKIQPPYKSNSTQKCKFNTASIPANITLDNWIGSGMEVVAGQTLTVTNFTAPPNKQSFYGTGTIALGSQTVYSAWFPGTDVGAQINAANAALGANKGTIRVSDGNFTIPTPIVNYADRTLHFGIGTYTFTNVGPSIKFKANNVIEGEGDNTILVESGGLADGVGVQALSVIANYYGTSSDALNGAIGGNNTIIRNLKIQGHAPVETSTASITATETTLTDSSGPFTADMVGWTWGITGAGPAPTNNLGAIITVFTSATQVTLDTAATSTVVNAKSIGAHFDSASQTVVLGNCHNCTVDNVTLENTHTIGIQSGGGSDTPNDAGTGTKTITTCTNAAPIVCTFNAAHGFPIGDTNIRLVVASVGGTTAANGYWDATPLTTTSVALNFSVGNGAYTTGGTAKQLGFGLNNTIRNCRAIGVASQNYAVVNSRGTTLENNSSWAAGQPYGPGVVVYDVEPNANDTIGLTVLKNNWVDATKSPADTDGSGGPKVLHGFAIQNTAAVADYGPVDVSDNTVIGTLAANAAANNISGAGFFLGAAKNTRLVNNTVRRTQHGIWLADANYNHVERNTLVSVGSGASSWAIFVQDSSNNHVAANRLYIDPTDALQAVEDREIHEQGTSDSNVYADNYAATIALLGASSTIPSNVDASLQSPKFCFTGGACKHVGISSPEGVVTAIVGSTYSDLSTGFFYTKNSGSGNTGWVVVGGSGGTISGPGSSTDNAFVLWDSTSGAVLKNSLGTMDTSGNIYTPGRVGIGVVATSPFHIAHQSDGTATVKIREYGLNAPDFRTERYNGTIASPTAVLDTNVIGAFSSSGYGATALSSAPRAIITHIAEGNWSDISQPAGTAFSTTTTGGIVTTEKMRLSGSGFLGRGTTTPAYGIDNVGDVNTTGTYRINGIDITGGFATAASDWKANNYLLAQHLGLTYKNENTQIETLSAGNAFIHGFIYAQGYMFAATNTSPMRMVRFNDLDDLTDYTSTDMTPYGSANDAVYVPSKDRIYILGNIVDKIRIVEFNPTTLAFASVVADLADINGNSITSDGSYLYVITNQSPSKVIKYSLTDFSRTSSVTLTARNSGHAIRYDGTTLYATGGASGAIGWAASINPSTLSFASASYTAGDEIPTDDFAMAGDYLFVGLENPATTMLRIKKSDLSIERLNVQISSGTCYGMFFDGSHVWGTYSGGELVRIDPVTLETVQFGFLATAGFLSPNEIFTDGQRLFVTGYTNPAKVGRFSIPNFDSGAKYVLNTSYGVDLSITSGNVGGVFRDKGGAVFNCKNREYGATGDGTTNDTTALNACFTAAAGNIAFIPKGTYIVNNLTSPAADTIIAGAGQGITILKRLTNQTVLDVPVINLTNARITLRDLTVDGNCTVNGPGTCSNQTTGSYALLWPSGADTLIENVEFKNVEKVGVYNLAARLVVRKSKFTGPADATNGAAFGIQAHRTNASDMIVENSSFNDFRLNAIITGGGSPVIGGHHTIRFNEFIGNHWSTFGGQIDSIGRDEVIGNRFYPGSNPQTSNSCIEMGSTQGGGIVIGNYCDGGGIQNIGIPIQGGTHYIVQGNYLTGFTVGIEVSESIAVTDYLNITGNDTQGNTTALTNASTGTHNVIVNNFADDPQTVEGRLAQVAGVDLNTATATTLYTCPASRTCVISKVVVRDASTSLTTASYSFGWNSAAFDNVIANATHTELTGSTLYTVLNAKAGATSGAAAGVFKILANTLQGGAATVTIDVFGYMY